MDLKFRWVVWFLICLICIPLGASEGLFSYPDVTETIAFTHYTERSFAYDVVAEFVKQWQPEGKSDSFALMRNLDTHNTLVGTLKSISRMRTAQLEQLRRQARPVFSIPNDPTNPLYSFRLMTTPSFSPPAGMVDKSSLTHQFGLNFSVAQNLPTAGSLNVTLKHGLSIVSEESGPLTWKQSPSVALTFQQPLGLGERLVDTTYRYKVEEKQMLQRTSALEAVEHTRQQVYLQTLTLLSRRQALLENKWISGQQALLADRALLDTQLDLDSGRVSRNQLIRQQAAFEQRIIQMTELDREIERVNATLETLVGEATADLPLIDVKAVESLATYKDAETLVTMALLVDDDYKEAHRDLQLAQIDKNLGTPSDAPMLSVSVQYSPYYTPSAGNGLLESFDELFSTSDPTVSVSVGFMAHDLFRSTNTMTKILIDEQILQASLRKEEAVQAITQKSSDYLLRIDQEFASLALLIDDYDFVLHELGNIHIQFAGGLVQEERIRHAELDVYTKAFAVLQKLRTMTLLAVELELFTGTLRL